MAWSIKLLSSQFRNLQRRGTIAFLVFAFAAVVALGKWLVLPWYFSPYVRIPSPTLSLKLRCVPSQLRIDSLTSYASLLKAQLVILSRSALSDGGRSTVFDGVPCSRSHAL
jgi:hypothetical protein